MKRRWFFAVLGTVTILAQLALLAVFGLGELDSLNTAVLLLNTAAGLLFVLGGVNARPLNVEWHQLVGLPRSSSASV